MCTCNYDTIVLCYSLYTTVEPVPPPTARSSGQDFIVLIKPLCNGQEVAISLLNWLFSLLLSLFLEFVLGKGRLHGHEASQEVLVVPRWCPLYRGSIEVIQFENMHAVHDVV